MKKLRYYLAAIVLAAILIASALLGTGAGAIANAVPGLHAGSVSTSFMTGKSTRSIAYKRLGWCPLPTYDC